MKKFVEKSTFIKLCPYFWFFCENREKCRYHPKVHSKQRGKSQNNRVVPITFVENHPFFKVFDNFEPFLALFFSTLGWHLQFYCFFFVNLFLDSGWIFGTTKWWTKRSKYDQNMNHDNSWTISDILKQVIESTDRDWTFIGEGEILERIGIVVTKFRLFANFLTHFLSKKTTQKMECFLTHFWFKNWTVFTHLFGSKTGPFSSTFFTLFWSLFKTSISKLWLVCMMRQPELGSCEA